MRYLSLVLSLSDRLETEKTAEELELKIQRILKFRKNLIIGLHLVHDRINEDTERPDKKSKI